MSVLWFALGIAGFIVILGICVVFSFIMMYSLWTVLSFLEFIYGLFVSKISAYPRSYAKPKFYLSELPKDIINGIYSTNNWLKRLAIRK